MYEFKNVIHKHIVKCKGTIGCPFRKYFLLIIKTLQVIKTVELSCNPDTRESPELDFPCVVFNVCWRSPEE
jgi:hypothetical protein